jgi:V8-like Glu-specific endopeptidase
MKGLHGLLGPLLVLCPAASLLGSCGGTEADGHTVADPIAEGLLPANWLGLELGVVPPTFVDRGEVEIQRDQFGSTAVAISRTPGPFDHGDPNAYDVTDYRTGHHYDVVLPDAIGVVAAERARRQLATQAADSAHVGGAVESESKSISGENDTRRLLSIANGVSADSYAAAVGLLDGGGCTGTLIAEDAYITAAHCIVTKSVPGKRGGTRLARAILPRTDDSATWGIWEATQSAVPQAYMTNRCYEGEDEFREDCIQYDIALVRVTRDSYYQGRIWFYRAAAETYQQLLTRRLSNVGYPLCNYPDGSPTIDRPQKCTVSHLYGDGNRCDLGYESYGDPGSAYRPVVNHSCDTSEGHSGGPMFYFDDLGRPVLIGVHVSGNTGEVLAPNSFKRLSPNTLDWIHGLL